MQGDVMIVAKDLIKELDKNKVIEGISFRIPRNECTGIIGLNGAGKTTIINMLTGLLLPDSGLVRVNGVNPYKNRNENLKQIGCVNGLKTQLWQDMLLKYSFENSRRMYNISDKVYEKNMKMLKETLELDKLMNTTVSELSLGERIRADFAYAILHSPEVLYLDEPTIGLDVVVKAKVLNLLKEINKEKKTTVVYTSHNLNEIEMLCKRVIIIDKGRKIFEGDIEKLKKEYSPKYMLELRIEGRNLPDLQDLPIYKYVMDGEKLLVYYDKKSINTSTLLTHIIKQCNVKQIQIHEPALEDIIKKIYEMREQKAEIEN